jgi:cobyrinic acid a,c-diamide synthase
MPDDLPFYDLTSSRGLVVAATSSRSGKTTVSAALMKVYLDRGMSVQGAKVGPDYIDPQFHRLATNRASYNLDPFLTGGEEGLSRTLRHMGPHDLLLVEGVMGLFDGTYLEPPSWYLERRERDSKIPFSSTAQVAEVLGLPVVLLVDVSSVASSVAAVVAGFLEYSKSLNIAGVILNKVGSVTHEAILDRSLSRCPVPIVGKIPKLPELHTPSRHLGLIQPHEEQERMAIWLNEAALAISNSVDLDLLVALAEPPIVHRVKHRVSRLRFLDNTETPIVSVAKGSAFSFIYEENLDILKENGAKIRYFDPLTDTFDTDTTHLYIGGGYPELEIEEIAKNTVLTRDIRSFALGGGSLWAECGGHMLLGRAIDGVEAVSLLPHRSYMTKKLSLGYRVVTATRDNPLTHKGMVLPAHEYHYSLTQDDSSDLRYVGYGKSGASGVARDNIISSYMHFHLGAIQAASLKDSY